MEEIARKHNEKHPDESPGAGVFKYVSVLENEIKGIEKERCEMTNDQHCAMLMNYVNVNELKAQDNECNGLTDKYDKLNVNHDTFHIEVLERVKQLLDCKDDADNKNDKLV